MKYAVLEYGQQHTGAWTCQQAEYLEQKRQAVEPVSEEQVYSHYSLCLWIDILGRLCSGARIGSLGLYNVWFRRYGSRDCYCCGGDIDSTGYIGRFSALLGIQRQKRDGENNIIRIDYSVSASMLYVTSHHSHP